MLKITVIKGNINKALKIFKRKFKQTGILKNVRDNKSYTKKSTKRKLAKEKTLFYDNNIDDVVNTHYPDIRKIINTLQGSVVDGQIKIDDNSLKNSQLGGLVVDALIRKAKLSEIRQILADSGAREFDDLFKYIYDKSPVLFGDREGEAILIIAKYQYEYTFVLEKEICIAAMLNKLLDIC